MISEHSDESDRKSNSLVYLYQLYLTVIDSM